MTWRVLLASELLPDPQPGGLVRHVLSLADALHQRGCHVDLLGNALHPIANHPDQAGPGRFFGEVRGHQRLWKERALGCFHPLRTVFNVQGLRAAIVAHAAGYDVVHYHGHLPWVGALLPASVPFTQTRHDTSGDCMLKTRMRPGRDDEAARCISLDPADCAACAAPAPNALQRAVSTRAVRHLRVHTAAALNQRPVIFVSQHLRAQAERAGAQAPLGEVIHHALPRDRLQVAAGAAPALREPGVSVQVFGAAALWPYKGFGALLDALAARELPAGWQLAIAGDGPQRAALQQRHPRLPLRWLGWQPHAEVLRLTAAADAVVVPSIWDEPCGATVLEGLALGRVVYALRRGGPPELAVYAGRGGDRLRLFDTLDELADALLSHPGGAVPAVAALADFSGDTDHLAEAVLAHYARHFGSSDRT